VEKTAEVVVTGLSLTTALGPSASATWKKLMAGESAIALRQPFLDLAPGPLAMQGKMPLALGAMTQALVQAAWADAGFDYAQPSGHQHNYAQPSGNQQGFGADCGVVMGSSRSYLRTWEAMAFEQRQGQAIQGDWLAALPHGPALIAARGVGSLGPLLAPMAACATGVWAIAQAADLIRGGQCSRVVAGAVESPITPLTLTGFRKMGALATTGCYPFDRRREGFVLGEGGAVLVLETAALAEQRGAKIYGKILAAGITNDSHHVSSFDPSYAMGRRALAQCLQRSGLTSEAIDAVHMHGTSTVQNDRMEASLIAQLLGQQIPVMATKGATGHTLGASGALVVALSLLSLQRQALLPCVGLQDPDFGLNFVHQGREITADERLEHMLCFSFGFGGQNAVLALSRWA
jgi:3-oxoacyl-[acyl-carrier-protein] synthase II